MMKGALIVLALACAASACCLALSIESEPVKVTHRNSGPRYDISENEMDVDKSKLTPVVSEAPAGGAAESAGSATEKPVDEADQIPLGRVSIRRIFLIPMMRAPSPEAETESEPEERNHEMPPQPSVFAKPFWPFLTPASAPHPANHHLFGADEASRSPSEARDSIWRNHREREHKHRQHEQEEPNRAGDQDRAESGEREGAERPLMMRPPPMAGNDARDHQGPLFDPIQMMLEMMQQAINGQLAPPQPNGPNSPDLNREASSRGDGGSGSEQPATSEERPLVPSRREPTLTSVSRPSNETREDIVEIDGKKYLRKTVTNRHIGENIVFMTRRLIFVPLNETDSSSPSPSPSAEQPSIPTTTTTPPPTTTTTEASAPSTSAAPQESNEQPTAATSEIPAESRSASVKPVEAETPAASTEATTTTTTTTAEPTTPVAASEPTTSGKDSEPTTMSSSSSNNNNEGMSTLERVSEVISAAERLVERVGGSSTTSTTTTTTEKPAVSSS